MKYMFLTFVLGFIIQTTVGQISFKIDVLRLSYYNVKLDSCIIDEDSEKGPYVELTCSMFNNSDYSILLKPSHSIIDLVFSYKGSYYTIDIVSLPFMANETIVILPYSSINLILGSYLLLGTEIFNYKRGDYTKEMISILPTLKVVYQDEGIKVSSEEIKEVILR